MAQAIGIQCSNCRQPIGWNGNPFRPFCSERCKMVDLGNWALERYRIEGEPVAADDLVAEPEGQATGRPPDES